MPDEPSPTAQEISAAERLARLEARLSRLESHLGLVASDESSVTPPAAAASVVAPPVSAAPPLARQQVADELELEVGQNWFASVGILVLAVGAGFMLIQPYGSLPAIVPSIVGLAVSATLFLVAHQWRRSFELVASHLRGAGMVLLHCATLRLFFFGAPPALSINSPIAPILLGLTVVINVAIALRLNSPLFTVIALLTGASSALAVGSAWWVLGSVVVLTAATTAITRQRQWPWLMPVGAAIFIVTYSLWAVGNPARGGAFHYVGEPLFAPAVLLLIVIALSVPPLLIPVRDSEEPSTISDILVACVLGYGTFLVHTAAAFPRAFALLNITASAMFVGLAVAYWLRRHSRVSTFFLAMTGYAALSMAIIKWAPMPELFVWLSLESLLVVTTAIWFRSRAIVVANFLIYVAIVLAYVFIKKSETGISLGFGVVALLSARILNWQKHRLELQTEMMRNAYLFCAFIVFPYALFHLVPVKVAGLAWIAMATVYYVLNFIVRNQKYRWMGHGTLLLTAVYLIFLGGRQLETVWRVATFLVLGVALLVVSLTFTRLKQRETRAAA